MEHKAKARLVRDLGIVGLSIIVALMLIESGVIHKLLGELDGYYFIGALITGLFFTSAFTTAPAIVVLAELSLNFNPFVVAILGGLGAVLGDLIIFSFVKKHVSKDVTYLLSHIKSKRIRHIFKYRFMRWSLAFVGALIIASPLPDELGLTLMGLSKMSTRRFMLVSFIFNTLGILLIGYVAHSLQ